MSVFASIMNGAKRPLICIEVNPPRGVNLEPVFARLDGQLDGIDLLNVTDCALAKMKLAAIPFAAILKNRYGKEVLANVSCRDRNVMALQSDLLAGWINGVRSIVALTGDAMTIGDTPDRKGVFEVNSVGLLNLVSTLNSGRDVAGHELKGACGFFPGAVVNPNVKNIAAELKRLMRKKEAGARYALSQPVFDKAAAKRFLAEAAPVGVPIFLGLLPFKSAAAALAINNVPGIRLPEGLTTQLAAAGGDDLSQFSVDLALEIAEETRGLVAGFHVVSGATPTLALTLARQLAQAVASWQKSS